MSISFNLLVQDYYIKREEKRFLKLIRHSMKSNPMKPLTASQKAEVKAFFKKHIGREVPTDWHQYFYSRNGFWSEKYIPTSVYNTEILWRLNKFQFRYAYADKGIYDSVFSDINRPRTIVKNVNGYFYDGQYQHPLSETEAVERCSNLKEAIIKPTLGGTWGVGVKLIHSSEGIVTDTSRSIIDLFASYKYNYIVQERLEQHPDLAKLNPTSLNTIRVMSYHRGDEVIILYAVIRIGRKGQIIDNETAGGIKADIDLQTGRIKGSAMGGPTEARMPLTDVGTPTDGYQIPCFDKVLETVKEMHLRIPYFNLIGWDMSVDIDGKPTLIEWNSAPQLSQVGHGPAFGDLTEEILDEAMRRENTRFNGLYWSYKLINF